MSRKSVTQRLVTWLFAADKKWVRSRQTNRLTDRRLTLWRSTIRRSVDLENIMLHIAIPHSENKKAYICNYKTTFGNKSLPKNWWNHVPKGNLWRANDTKQSFGKSPYQKNGGNLFSKATYAANGSNNPTNSNSTHCWCQYTVMKTVHNTDNNTQYHCHAICNEINNHKENKLTFNNKCYFE